MPSIHLSPPITPNLTQVHHHVLERLWTRFEEQCLRRPDHVAVHDLEHEQVITYEQIQQSVQHRAAQLRAAGVVSGALVGVFLKRSVEALIASLAVVWAEGVFLPLDPTLPSSWTSVLLEQTRVMLLLTTTAYKASLPPAQECPVHYLDRLREEDTMLAADALPLDAPGGVLLTAGMNGLPKAVRFSRQHLRTLMEGDSYSRLTATDRIAQSGPFWSFQALFEIWSALGCGATLVLLPNKDLSEPRQLRHLLRKEGITVMSVPTALFHRLARQQPAIFASLKTLLVGGEPVHTAAIQAVRQAGAPARLLFVYGLAEAGGWCLSYELPQTGVLPLLVPLGTPHQEQAVVLLDAAGEVLEQEGVVGELVVAGAMVAQDYPGFPDLTAASFPMHPLLGRLVHTGDLASWRRDAQGQRVLVWEGRREAVLLRQYEQTREGARLEARLCQHEAIEEVAVLVRRKQAGVWWVMASVVLKSATRPQQQAVAQEIAVILKRLMPSCTLQIIFLGALPLTPAGRVERHRLALRDVAPPPDTRQAPREHVTYTDATTTMEAAHV